MTVEVAENASPVGTTIAEDATLVVGNVADVQCVQWEWGSGTGEAEPADIGMGPRVAVEVVFDPSGCDEVEVDDGDGKSEEGIGGEDDDEGYEPASVLSGRSS